MRMDSRPAQPSKDFYVHVLWAPKCGRLRIFISICTQVATLIGMIGCHLETLNPVLISNVVWMFGCLDVLMHGFSVDAPILSLKGYACKALY